MFHKVKWQKIETEEAAEKYDIGEASNGSIELDDLGDAPEHFLVHKGNLTLAGNHSYGETLKEDPDGIVVCVVDGDLTFEGNFKFWSADVYHVLLVTGSLTCERLTTTWDGQIFVGKDLNVKDTLVTDLTDAGHLIVKGALKAVTWIECAGRGAIELGKKPKCRYVTASDEEDDERPKAIAAAKVLLPAFFEDGELNAEKLTKAAYAGKPLFR